jgi:hypothetical protein
VIQYSVTPVFGIDSGKIGSRKIKRPAIARGRELRMTPEEMIDHQEALFKAGQQPSAWLESAKRLRDAAEIIFEREQANEIPYFQAYQVASESALGIACAACDGTGSAEIQCEPPNYLPGQLLCAFAFENALKGLIVANQPSLMGETKINRAVKSHDLIELAKRADFAIGGQEPRILDALSQIGEWAGRYPVASSLDRHGPGGPLGDSHVLLDYGADHVTVRRVLMRAIDALEARLLKPIGFGVVVVTAPRIS